MKSTALAMRFDAMTADIPGDFAAAGGVPDEDCVCKVKFFQELREATE
jgi:hypothetical protein